LPSLASLTELSAAVIPRLICQVRKQAKLLALIRN
jgi:hypothetical protein